jgi:hypothetical protein
MSYALQLAAQWIRALLGDESSSAPGFQLVGQVVNAPPKMATLIPPVQIVPAAKHRVTFHKDWGVSPRVGTWSEIRALWRIFANRGSANPYDRPTIYKEPAGGAGWIDGQRVRYRDPRKGGEIVPLRVQDRPPVGYPPIVQVFGHEIRSSRIFWRDRDSWLHWKSRVYMSTARWIDTLPRIPEDGKVVVQANLHFGVHKRCIQNKVGKAAEELAASIGQIYPYSAWAVEAFGDADPTFWRHSDLRDIAEFQALRSE